MIYNLLFVTANECRYHLKGLMSPSLVPDSSFTTSPGSSAAVLARPGAINGWTGILPCWVAVDVGKYLSYFQHVSILLKD